LLIIYFNRFNTISWDPIFEPFMGPNNDEPGIKTYAEMTSEEKNSVSHRMKSLNLLTKFLNEQPPTSTDETS
jgi:inosine/xanthosine triphosphate pyrophosphatase family protein